MVIWIFSRKMGSEPSTPLEYMANTHRKLRKSHNFCLGAHSQASANGIRSIEILTGLVTNSYVEFFKKNELEDSTPSEFMG